MAINTIKTFVLINFNLVMSSFKDSFSKQSDIYVKYRPHYPVELYEFLSTLTPQHKLAWDCGSGNGQAAIGVAAFYDQVIATDPSKQQIKNAMPHEKVIYKVETAEQSSLENDSVDLITIANAVHWFDHDLFYKEVNRVLKKDGIIAAWCYGVPFISPEIDMLVKQYHDNVLGDYWQEPNRLVEKEYTTLPFPFEEMESPPFFAEKKMSLKDFIGFLNTWSATQRYIETNHSNPTEILQAHLLPLWGNLETEMKLYWKIVLKIGRVPFLNRRIIEHLNNE